MDTTGRGNTTLSYMCSMTVTQSTIFKNNLLIFEQVTVHGRFLWFPSTVKVMTSWYRFWHGDYHNYKQITSLNYNSLIFVALTQIWMLVSVWSLPAIPSQSTERTVLSDSFHCHAQQCSWCAGLFDSWSKVEGWKPIRAPYTTPIHKI